MGKPVSIEGWTSTFPTALRKRDMSKARTLTTTSDKARLRDIATGPFATSTLHEIIPLANIHDNSTRPKQNILVFTLIGAKTLAGKKQHFLRAEVG